VSDRLKDFFSTTAAQVVGTVAAVGLLTLLGAVVSARVLLEIAVAIALLLLTVLVAGVVRLNRELGELRGQVEEFAAAVLVDDQPNPQLDEVNPGEPFDVSTELGPLKVTLLRMYLNVEPPVRELRLTSGKNYTVMRIRIQNTTNKTQELVDLIMQTRLYVDELDYHQSYYNLGMTVLPHDRLEGFFQFEMPPMLRPTHMRMGSGEDACVVDIR
jgi:hypothetical protein